MSEAEESAQPESANETTAAASADPEKPFAVFQTSEQLNDRIARAARARLREMGVDPEQARRDREELEALKKADEERRAAEMSEVERAKQEAQTALEAKAAAEAVAEKARRDADIARMAARHRVPDMDYLAFRLQSLPEGSDEEEWLGQLLKDEKERVRFGVQTEPPEPAQSKSAAPAVRATTSTTQATRSEPQPHASNEPDEMANAMEMTPEEYRRYRSKKLGNAGNNTRRGWRPPGV